MRTVKDRISFLNALNIYLPKDCIGAELGVLRGDFSEMILDIINPKKLYLVDPFVIGNALYGQEMDNLPISYSTQDDYESVIIRFEHQINTDQVVIRKDHSYEAYWRFNDNVLDFCYHDASHLYLDLKKDLKDWLPKMKKDAVVSGHDYNSIFEGVKKAVDEFCQEHNFEMIIYNEHGGDFALKKIV